MTRPCIRLLSDAERSTLHEQTLAVLEEVGIAFNTPAAIDLLEEDGRVRRPRAPHGAAAARAGRALSGDRADAKCCSPPATLPTTYGWVTVA